MTQVDYFCTRRLQYAAHDIDCSIMPVEQCSCSNKTYLMFGSINFVHFCFPDYPVKVRIIGMPNYVANLHGNLRQKAFKNLRF